MSFLKKLLAPKQTAPEMVSKAEHEAAIEALKDEIATLNDELRAERNSVGNLVQRNRNLTDVIYAARAEAEANKADAEAHRRSKANLKQFRTGKAA